MAGWKVGRIGPPWLERVGEDRLVGPIFRRGIRLVGQGGTAALPGGPLAAVAFALGRCARRGLPLKSGYVVATGTAAGIHEIRIGQSACVRFAGVAELPCRAVAAAKSTRT